MRKPGRPPKVFTQESQPKDGRTDKMNLMANAVWLGQSPNLGLPERIGRIKAAMKKHGFGDILGEIKINDKVNQSFTIPAGRTYRDYL